MSDINGKITDSTGEALTGANVYISDSAGKVINPPTGGTADADGKYTLKAKTGDFITATFVGMANQTKKVGTVNTQNFILAPSMANSLHAVEIVADRVTPLKPKPKTPIGVIIFISLAGLLLIVGGVIEYNESR